MNITLSNRAKTVFTRFVEVFMDAVIKDAKKLTGDGDEDEEEYVRIHRVGKWRLRFSPTGPLHHDGCPCDGEAIPRGDDGTLRCTECDVYPASIHFGLDHNDRHIASMTYGLSMTLETFSTWIQELPTDWSLCLCKTVLRDYPSPKEGVCGQCYIHSYTRTEEEGGVCCICHENEGRWVKLSCVHAIHYHCHLNMNDSHRSARGLKCPLCREDVKGLTMDPYDV